MGSDSKSEVKSEWSTVTRKKNKSKNSGSVTIPRPRFRGRCNDLAGHIFDLGPHQITQFARTKKEIINFIGVHYIAELQEAVEKMVDMRSTFVEPVYDPPKDDKDAMNILKIEKLKYELRIYLMKS